MIDEYKLNEEGLQHVVCLDGLTVGFVVAHDRLREGDADVLDGHLVMLIGGGHSSQMSCQIPLKK